MAEPIGFLVGTEKWLANVKYHKLYGLSVDLVSPLPYLAFVRFYCRFIIFLVVDAKAALGGLRKTVANDAIYALRNQQEILWVAHAHSHKNPVSGDDKTSTSPKK